MTNSSNSAVRAVVLAAGQGKRMKSSLPKVLHEVLGRAIISRVLDALDELELEKVHVVVGHGAEQVTRYLQDHAPVTPLSTHLQQPQLGTGHALMQVADSLADFAGTLLVVAADTPLVTAGTLEELLAGHREKRAAVSLLSAVVDDPKSYGRVLRDAAGAVIGVVEDRDATEEQRRVREVNTAIYCLEWPAVSEGLSALKADNKQGEYYLTDLVGWAQARRFPVSGTVAADWREVGGINSRLELAEAARLLNDRVLTALALQHGVTVVDPGATWIAPEVRIGQDSVVLPGCLLFGDVEIGRECIIGPHTVIHGPSRVGDRSVVRQSLVSASDIGSDCGVGPFAHLREGAQISDGARIGNYVEVKKSTVGSRTNVSHLSYVGDASVGSGVNIGAGTITANYDHIRKTKSRTVIGDGVSTGSNSVLVAPVAVGDGAVVAAGTVVTKDVPAGALAVGRAKQENKPGWTEARRRLAASEKQ